MARMAQNVSKVRRKGSDFFSRSVPGSVPPSDPYTPAPTVVLDI